MPQDTPRLPFEMKVVAHARRTLLRLSAALQHALLRRVPRTIARLAPA